MAEDVNPDMIVVAREARGLTQSALADRIGVSQGTISKYESGLRRVSDEDAAAIAKELRFPLRFFAQTDRVYGFGSTCFYHRKRQRMPVGQLRRLQAQLNIFRFQVVRLTRGIEIESENEFVRLDVSEYGTPQEVARAVRALWKLPMGPVRNVIATVENAGAIVYELDFGTRHLDAISQIAPGCPPVVFVNSVIPADRLRLTFTHEIGHMIMHQIPTEDMELQADRFAAEFLMPEREIRPSLRKLSLRKLAALKQEWLVAMNALLKRAQDLGEISSRYARTLWTQMAKQGWRTKEPIDIPREKPTVFGQILQVHLTDHGYTVEELSKVANALPERFSLHFSRLKETDSGGFRVVG
jgi:Zn-dependent peptidase ImmA (M78 family)/DNA-binding XRE family transcriptional regulator